MIEEIILGLDTPTKYDDIAREFERRSHLEVTVQRVRQVAAELKRQGKVNIAWREDHGQIFAFVSPRRSSSDSLPS